MAHKGNPIPYNNPPNMFPTVPADPDPILSYSSSLDLSDSLYSEYCKERLRTKNKKINDGLKHVSVNLSKSAQILHTGYLHPRKNQRL